MLPWWGLYTPEPDTRPFAEIMWLMLSVMLGGLSLDRRWLEEADDGCGISEPALERIFEPLFTTREIGEGTGLGLAISYGIVKQHGGRILLESAVGVGTRFTVRLPG